MMPAACGWRAESRRPNVTWQLNEMLLTSFPAKQRAFPAENAKIMIMRCQSLALMDQMCL
jgi:hypothetical protein